jgi:hypothetical protein
MSQAERSTEEQASKLVECLLARLSRLRLASAAPYCVYGGVEAKRKGRGVDLYEMLFVMRGVRQKAAFSSLTPGIPLALTFSRRYH